MGGGEDVIDIADGVVEEKRSRLEFNDSKSEVDEIDYIVNSHSYAFSLFENFEKKGG